MNAVSDSSIVSLFLSAGIVARLVLGTLLLASIVSWAVILYKWFTLRRVESENRRFLILFSKAEDLEDMQRKALKRNDGPLSLLLRTALRKIDTYVSSSRVVSSGKGIAAMKLSIIERTLQGATQEEISYQERYLHILATIGNTAPFIGLLGTVWGIMGAFQEIGTQGSANIAVVAPGVAEALVNTATGLFVAIPAAVSYNVFINRIRKMHVQMEVFSSEVVTMVEEKIGSSAFE